MPGPTLSAAGAAQTLGSDLRGISPRVQQAIIDAVIILVVRVDELRRRRFK